MDPMQVQSRHGLPPRLPMSVPLTLVATGAAIYRDCCHLHLLFVHLNHKVFRHGGYYEAAVSKTDPLDDTTNCLSPPVASDWTSPDPPPTLSHPHHHAVSWCVFI